MKLRLLVIGLVALSLAGDDKAKDDKDKIQGTWVVQKLQRGGEETELAADGVKLTFKGDKFIINFSGQEYEGTFKLDPAKKPKQIDMVVNEQTRVGIYELDGDMLKICRGEPGEERPTEFKTKEGTGQIMTVSKREKAEKK